MVGRMRLDSGRVYKAALLCSLLTVSCKETVHSGQDDLGEGSQPQLVSVESYASDAVFLQKNSNFFARIWDRPFTRKLADMPLKAETSEARRPYSGSYYGNLQNGTNVRVTSDAQTVLQKYDRAFNSGSRRAELWEQCNQGPIDCSVCDNNTGECRDSVKTRAVAWAGHCNGFAAAALRHREPVQDVTKGGVVFRPQDIKALLAEIYLSADFEFLGGNRCGSSQAKLRASRQDPTIMDECEDINPGTFHAVIANWIGVAKHGLVMDISPDDQIWNYPVYQYEVLQMDKNLTAAQALAQLNAGSSSKYKFNPSATSFAKVSTKITYAYAGSSETLGKLVPYALTLNYILELNSAGEILGGEWIGASERNHPDFIWVGLEPLTPNGTKFMGNPHVDATAVLELWAESVGGDGQIVTQPIKRPSTTRTWGKWPSFEVTLDGRQNGAVFSGKPIVLDVLRKSTLATGNVELDLSLNGNFLTKLTADSNASLRHVFEPGLGLNRLQMVWRKDGTQVEEQYLRFHVVR